jgi:hypothetical protein
MSQIQSISVPATYLAIFLDELAPDLPTGRDILLSLEKARVLGDHAATFSPGSDTGEPHKKAGSRHDC